ncbi:hypothetical protein MMC25_003282 [Agyrium rufum]|nr:hypothetical protein [Agyrium rufum]
MSGLVVPPPSGESYLENGRLYHGYRRGIYMFPCDEQEKDRMDIYHKILLEARNGELHQAHLSPAPDEQRILDLGTGTGIWAIDMADRYPDAEVVGIDLVNIQPASIPRNLRFRTPRDYESPWTLGEDSWDLIHLQMAAGSVSSWPEMYDRVFGHLKPGTGYFEQVEIDTRPRFSDGSYDETNQLVKWYEWLSDATARANRPIAYQKDTPDMLKSRGFVDIVERVIRLPINSWPLEQHEKNVGRWYNLGLCEGLEAMGMGPLTRNYNWPPNDIRRLCGDVKVAMCNRSYRVWHEL